MMNINMFQHAQLGQILTKEMKQKSFQEYIHCLVEVRMTWTGILYFTVCVLLKL